MVFIGKYEQPRNVLKHIAEVAEVGEERVNSLCCGGSIGDLSMNAAQRNVIRDGALSVLCESEPDILVTACPLCKKTFEAANQIVVKDIAEIVNERMVVPQKKDKIQFEFI